jgi:hypothetical protein
MSYGPLATNPATVSQGTTENVYWAIDMTAALPAGGTVTAPATVFTDLNSGTVIALTDSPTVSGNVVTQRVTGNKLTANHLYEMAVTYTAAANVTLTSILLINCPT